MKEQPPIYLDYMATTPVDPRVVDVMLSLMGPSADFGNPASTHTMGMSASRAVEVARGQVASTIGASPEEIIWTSGATEADNLAIIGAAEFYQRKGNHLITLKTEHKAVLDSFAYLERKGFEVTYLEVNQDGLLDLQMLADNIKENTILVSVMHVNNELGVIQPIQQIADLVRTKGILLHVDAAQSIGKISVDVSELQVDLLSMSAHKVYGPKGIGALYVRRKPRVRLKPMSFGGGHEQGLRSGTLAPHQIAGMGKAFEIAQAELDTSQSTAADFFERIMTAMNRLGGVVLNGSETFRVPHNLNLSFDDVDGEALLYAISPLCVSTSSACTSASIEPSYVLKSLGVPDPMAYSTLRLSTGRFTSEQQVTKAIEIIREQVTRLRKLYT